MRIKPRIDLGIPHEPRRLPKRGIAPSLSIFEAIKIAQAYVDSEDLYLDRVQLGKPSRLGGKNCWRVTWEKKVFTMGGNQSFFVDMHGNSGKWRPGM